MAKAGLATCAEQLDDVAPEMEHAKAAMVQAAREASQALYGRRLPSLPARLVPRASVRRAGDSELLTGLGPRTRSEAAKAQQKLRQCNDESMRCSTQQESMHGQMANAEQQRQHLLEQLSRVRHLRRA